MIAYKYGENIIKHRIVILICLTCMEVIFFSNREKGSKNIFLIATEYMKMLLAISTLADIFQKKIESKI